METIYLYIGAVALVLGTAGLVFTLVRFAGGSIPRWKAVVDTLNNVAALFIGMFFLLDLNALLLPWAVILVGAATYAARKKRELREQSHNGSA